MQNALHSSQQEALAASRGDLDLRLCHRCGFVWNAAFDSGLMSYAVGYENCQSHSAVFRQHLAARVARISAVAGTQRPLTVVEVGCGQGDFLALLARSLGGATAVGFDPSWRGADGAAPAGAGTDDVRLYRRLFDQDAAARLAPDPQLVLARHVIEHIADPIGFLRTIRAALPPHTTARLFIETPCNQWILSNGAVQDLFYEHCSVFDAGSLAIALRSAGFAPERIERVFGGQYLWAEATATRPSHLAGEIDRAFTDRWIAIVQAARTSGQVAVWGASAKGTTFLLLTDPQRALVDCVVDINPAKQGRFVPATGHAIVDAAEAAARGVTTVIVMNPNYRDEVLSIAHALGWEPSLHVLD